VRVAFDGRSATTTVCGPRADFTDSQTDDLFRVHRPWRHTCRHAGHLRLIGIGSHRAAALADQTGSVPQQNVHANHVLVPIRARHFHDLNSRPKPNQMFFGGRTTSSNTFKPAPRRSISERLPLLALAIIISPMRLRSSWVYLSGGIFLQTYSRAAVMLAIVF
jgi:hypothetical protein